MSFENEENYMNMNVWKTPNTPKLPTPPVDRTKNVIDVTAQRHVEDDNGEKDVYEEIAPFSRDKVVKPKSPASPPADNGYSGSPKLPPRRWVRPTNNLGQPSNGLQKDATLQPALASRDLGVTESPVVQPKLENYSSTESVTQDENPYDDPKFVDAGVNVDVSPLNGYRSSEGGSTKDDVNDVEENDFDDDCGSVISNRPSASRLNSTEHDDADDSSSQRSHYEDFLSAGATKTAADAKHSSNKSKSNTMLKMFTLKKSSGKDQTEPSGGGGRADAGAKSKSMFRLNLSSKEDTVTSDDQQESHKHKKKNSLTGSGDTIRATGSKLSGVGAHLSTLIGKNRSSPRPSLSSFSEQLATDALPSRSPCTPLSAADVDECSINSTADRQRQQQRQFHQRPEQTMSAELLQKLTSDKFTAATVRTLSRDEISDVMHHVIQLPLKAVAQLYGKEVNGSLLVHMTVDDLVEALKLDRIDAVKVRQFAVDGWLPDRLKFALARDATDDNMQATNDAIVSATVPPKWEFDWPGK